jgi:hypothetical protein
VSSRGTLLMRSASSSSLGPPPPASSGCHVRPPPASAHRADANGRSQVDGLHAARECQCGTLGDYAAMAGQPGVRAAERLPRAPLARRARPSAGRRAHGLCVCAVTAALIYPPSRLLCALPLHSVLVTTSAAVPAVRVPPLCVRSLACALVGGFFARYRTVPPRPLPTLLTLRTRPTAIAPPALCLPLLTLQRMFQPHVLRPSRPMCCLSP